MALILLNEIHGSFSWGKKMKNFIVIASGALAMCLISAPAFAGLDDVTHVPEPLSLSLLAGGIAAIAAVKRLRRK
jgi:hypothetical protein